MQLPDGSFVGPLCVRLVILIVCAALMWFFSAMYVLCSER